MSVDELGLTPGQLAELEHLDQALIDAWLSALEHVRGVHSPVGWFLAGVRSGSFPGAVADNEKEQLVRLVQRWLRNAGLYEPDEPSLLDALFGQHGGLRALASDEQLRRRMLELWRHEQPRAEQAKAEQLARALRWQQAHLAMQAIGTTRTVPHDDTQPLHSSQTSTALTAVSAHTSTSDVDADIPW